MALIDPLDTHPPVALARGSAKSMSSAFETAATATFGELQQALSAVLGLSPGESTRAADVKRRFGIDYRLAWEVHQVASAPSPLAAAPHVPSRASIQRLLKSAARRRVSVHAIERVETAFARFEEFVAVEAGDRDELDALAKAHLPDVREEQELEARRHAFKGMSFLTGAAAEATLAAFLLWPSDDRVSQDIVTIQADFGLRRMRPDAKVAFGSGHLTRPDATALTLDGREATPSANLATCLAEFSTAPLPSFSVDMVDGMVYRSLCEGGIGLRSAINLVVADFRRAAQQRYLGPSGKRINGLANTVSTPSRRNTVDVFVHTDLYTGVTPQLAVYNTASRGYVRVFGDPNRELDRYHTHDVIRAIPSGIAGAKLQHIPRYLEMLGYVCQKRGWDPAAFRGYRLDVEYPIFGAQYMYGFMLPDPPPGVTMPPPGPTAGA